MKTSFFLERTADRSGECELLCVCIDSKVPETCLVEWHRFEVRHFFGDGMLRAEVMNLEQVGKEAMQKPPHRKGKGRCGSVTEDRVGVPEKMQGPDRDGSPCTG